MRAHVLHDEKFTDQIISNILMWGGEGDVFFVWQSGTKLSFVKSSNIHVLRSTQEELSRITELFLPYDIIFFHYLTGPSIALVNKLPKDKCIVWAFWGADGYSLKKLKKDIYETGTMSLLREIQLSTKYPSIFNRIKRVLGDYLKERRMVSAFKKVKGIATWVEGDFSLVTSRYDLRCKRISFANFSIVQLFGNDIPDIDLKYAGSECKVLLGNSGDPSNNHIDIFDVLTDKGWEILCPLSYGPSRAYINKICELGFKRFDSRFKPLIDFLNKEDYVELIKSVDLIILNHIRQQAVGNSLLALVMGKVLFMNLKSPLFHTYISWGLDIRSLSDLKNGNIEMSFERRIANREIVLNMFSVNNVKRSYCEMLNFNCV